MTITLRPRTLLLGVALLLLLAGGPLALVALLLAAFLGARWFVRGGWRTLTHVAADPRRPRITLFELLWAATALAVIVALLTDGALGVLLGFAAVYAQLQALRMLRTGRVSAPRPG